MRGSSGAFLALGSLWPALILGGALAASATVLTLAVGTASYRWAGWLALVPLFLVIRTLTPAAALLAGAVWGSAVFAAGSGLVANVVAPTGSAWALLAAVPAAYCCLGAALTRWIGFSPFVLGVGWMGVELALTPLGFDTGILGSAESSAGLFHWIATGLGYVLVAFVVAYVNAHLAAAISEVRLTIPRPLPIIRAAIVELRVTAQQSIPLALLEPLPAQPRAPP